jgi:hypothetical protein
LSILTTFLNVTNVGRNVEYHTYIYWTIVFILLYIVLIRIVKNFTARNMESFKFSMCFCCRFNAFWWLTVRKLMCCNLGLELEHFLRWNVLVCVRLYYKDCTWMWFCCLFGWTTAGIIKRRVEWSVLLQRLISETHTHKNRELDPNEIF